MFDNLRARLDRFLAEHTVPADARSRAAALHDGLVEAKAAVAGMRDALERTEHALAAQIRQRDDAVRRGGLARDIDDQETAELAEQFAARHGERVEVLQRKLAVQREELALAERELAELAARFRSARPSTGGGAADSVESAWREVTSAGGERPGVDPADSLLAGDLDRAAREAAVEAQLAHLKKKLGKNPS